MDYLGGSVFEYWFMFLKLLAVPLIVYCIIQYAICRYKPKFSKILPILACVQAMIFIFKYLYLYAVSGLDLVLIVNGLFISLTLTSLFILFPWIIQKRCVK